MDEAGRGSRNGFAKSPWRCIAPRRPRAMAFLFLLQGFRLNDDLKPVAYLVGPDSAVRAGASPREESPAQFWHEVSRSAGDTAVLLVPQGGETAPGAMVAAGQMREAGARAASGSLIDTGDDLLAAGGRPCAGRYSQALPGSLMVSARLAATLAQRLSARRWDRYWASDLAALVHELCEPLATGQVFARLGGALPVTAKTLLPLSRAGFRPFDAKAPTVIVYGACDASTMLYLDAFSRCEGMNLRFLRPSSPTADLAWLTAASAVIMVRNIESHIRSGLAGLLRRLEIPVFWFVDDDFTVLAREGRPTFAFYDLPAFTEGVAQFSGLIASTAQLGEALTKTLGLDPRNVRILSPRVSPWWPTPPQKTWGVGIIGGTFRGEALRDELPGALADIGPAPRIVASDNLRPFLKGIAAQWEPFEPDFLTFLHRWQRQAPAVILHPPGRTSNLANKSIATILVAHSIGAVPIVADEPAYDGWGEAEGVLKLAPGAWGKALCRGLDPQEAMVLRDRLARALGGTSIGEPAADKLLALLGAPAPVMDDDWQDRLNAGLADRALASFAPPPALRLSIRRRIVNAVRRRLSSI